MDSDNDSSNSNNGPIHRRRTQGTRPVVSSSQSRQQNSIHRIPSSIKAENETYSEDDEIDEDEDDDEDHHQQNQQHSTYRGRGRPSHQQDLIDSSYDTGNEQHGTRRYTGPLREQDRFLPIANIAKIMKKGVPVKGKIAKDAKETIQECVSEFISFITSEASDRCLQEKRKTINGEDILLAMVTLGFDSYVEPLKAFLAKVRDASKYDRSITMGAELNDNLNVDVTETATNQTQISATPQIQSSATLPAQELLTKNSNAANGLEPYVHSVRVVTCIRNDQPGENPNYVYTIQPYQ